MFIFYHFLLFENYVFHLNDAILLFILWFLCAMNLTYLTYLLEYIPVYINCSLFLYIYKLKYISVYIVYIENI